MAQRFWLVLAALAALPAVRAFEMFDPLPATGVEFESSHPLLQRLFDHAETAEANNSRVFYRPDPALPEPFAVIIEGAQYLGAWPETQPMAGAMYAARSVRLALNNQLVFTRTQRSDGRIANVVFCGQVHSCKAPSCAPNGSLPMNNSGIPLLQGFYMASPMVDLAWWMALAPGNQAVAYLEEVAAALEALDSYLWNTRNDSACFGLTNGSINGSSCPGERSPNNTRGLLWSLGAGDTGEDSSQKYRDNTLPVQQMDMMAYSHDNRRSLARIALLLNDTGAFDKWSAAAREVAQLATDGLWREDLGAMFDLDLNNEWVTTLTHNTLRVMWHGLLSQQQADAFVTRHLMNASEFWTNGMPLTTVSVSDPRFVLKTSDGWTGAPEGLTLQRSIRALESYTHLAELTMAGRALTKSLLRGCIDNSSIPAGCHFGNAIDPFTGQLHHGDNYGPMIMAFLEHLARRVGIVPSPEFGLLWSGLQEGADSNYTQRLGDRKYTLQLSGEHFTAVMVDSDTEKTLFTCTAGVRVVTDLSGHVTEVWGIDPISHMIELRTGGVLLKLEVRPNQVWRVNGASAALSRAAPFVKPFS